MQMMSGLMNSKRTLPSNLIVNKYFFEAIIIVYLIMSNMVFKIIIIIIITFCN